MVSPRILVRGGQAARTCAAADRTGHALLHALYQGNLKGGTTFLNEWYAVDLVKNKAGQVAGVIAICIETGEVVYIKAKATVMATGGAGRIYASTTNALINTGDGVGMALRAGFMGSGHGDVAVPPHWYLWCGCTGDRGVPG